ncbi:vancomycin high temperature exclusion protein [Streptomyces sp. NPDC052396]|uniref:vancomycin high temperature exclusion protein n=1 Tax=Streptomyces sp. NPDC052396 TaxID=3365689 RepID=UPI0037CD0096
MRLPTTRRGKRRLLWAVMTACVLALLPATWVYATTGDRLRTVADAPKAPVAMVFGAGLWHGKPSPYLADRLDTAVDLYRQGKVRALLVTGDNSRESYDEPDAMHDYLVAHGVPDRRIVRDYAGFDTWDSCARAERVFGVHRALLVSQDFHIRRAVALCRAAGIDSYGVAAAVPHDLTWLSGGVREVPAAAKAAFNAALRPGPTFLGPHEPGVEQALADR